MHVACSNEIVFCCSHQKNMLICVNIYDKSTWCVSYAVECRCVSSIANTKLCICKWNFHLSRGKVSAIFIFVYDMGKMCFWFRCLFWNPHPFGKLNSIHRLDDVVHVLHHLVPHAMKQIVMWHWFVHCNSECWISQRQIEWSSLTSINSSGQREQKLGSHGKHPTSIKDACGCSRLYHPND